MQFFNQIILLPVASFSASCLLAPMCFSTFLCRVPEFHSALSRVSTTLRLAALPCNPTLFVAFFIVRLSLCLPQRQRCLRPASAAQHLGTEDFIANRSLACRMHRVTLN